MKHSFSRLLAIFGLLCLLITGCRKEEVTPVVADASATFKVPEMHCASCVGTIRAALRGLPGVDDTPVFDLEKREVSVKWSSTKVDRAAIEAAIAKSGFKVGADEPTAAPPAP